MGYQIKNGLRGGGIMKTYDTSQRVNYGNHPF